jgi:hypothetical protein
MVQSKKVSQQMVQYVPSPKGFRYPLQCSIRLERRLENHILGVAMVGCWYHCQCFPNLRRGCKTDVQIRCVFRVAEFSQGYDGKLRTVEFWFYVLPLVLGIAVWAVVWPPQIMEEEREFIGTGGSGLTSGHEMGGVDATSKGSSQSGLLGYQQPQSHQSQVYQPRGYPPQGHQVQGYSRA